MLLGQCFPRECAFPLSSRAKIGEEDSEDGECGKAISGIVRASRNILPKGDKASQLLRGAIVAQGMSANGTKRTCHSR